MPSAQEIGKVTDYVVAYACKGNESLIEERLTTEALILQEKEKMGDDSDVKALAKKIMNNTIKTKLISKQEAICQTIGLPLYLCSENFFRISLSGMQKIVTDNTKTFKPILQQYANRLEMYENESLYEYVKRNQKTKNSTIDTVPHFTGTDTKPKYPPTLSYATTMLTIYRPWRDLKSLKNNPSNLNEYNKFIKSTLAPAPLIAQHHREKQRYLSQREHHEPLLEKKKIQYLNC